MAPSCLKSLSFVLGAVLAGVAAAHAAAAAAAPAAPTLAAPLPTGLGSCHQPITLDAASSQVDYKTNTVDFRQVVISQGTTRVQADHAHATGLNFNNSRWTFDGNVHIEAEQRGNLRSDQAVVEFKDNRITRATITGKPAEFEQKRADSDQLARGHADEIVYDVDRRHGAPVERCLALRRPDRDVRTAAGLQHPRAARAGRERSRHRSARAHQDPDGCGPEPRQGRAREARRRSDAAEAGIPAVTALKATGLAKSYKSRQVVRDLSLELDNGEVVGLLGPNGAGKTTAFYMIVGLVPCDAGRIYLGDTDLTLAAHASRARSSGSATCRRKPRCSASSRSRTTSWRSSRRATDLERAAREQRLEELLEELRIGHVRKTPRHVAVRRRAAPRRDRARAGGRAALHAAR